MTIVTKVPLIGVDIPIGNIFSVEGVGAGISPSFTGKQNFEAFRSALSKASVAGSPLGGIVTVNTPGVYPIFGSMGLPNYVELNVGAGVILQRAASMSSPLVKNSDAAYLIQATAWSRTGSVVTVNDVGHTFTVGQKIFLPPSRFTDTTFGGVATVTAVTAGTWSYASAGSSGAGGTSLQHIPVIPITRTIANASLAAVTVNTVRYIQVTDAVGDIPVGTQIHISTDNTADSAFWGMVDAAVVTTTGWVFKVPGNTAGLPAGNLTINYSVFTRLTGQGIIDGNYPNQGGGNNIISLSPCLFSNVSFHRVDAGIKVQSSNIRCINYFNPSNVFIDCEVDNTKVGIQIEGGYKKVRVARVSGSSEQNSTWDGAATKQATDDFFAFSNTLYTGDGTGGAQNYDNVSSPFGITGSADALIDELNAYNALNGIKVTGDASGVFDRIKVGVIRMYGLDPNRNNTGAALAINDDGPHLKGTSFTEIRVDSVIWDDDTTNGTTQRNLNFTGTGNWGTLVLQGLKQQAGMAQGVIYGPGSQSVTSCTNAGTTVTVVTPAVHGLSVGSRFVISGITSNAAYNGVYQVKAVTDTFTFTFDQGIGAGAITGTMVITGSVGKYFKAEYSQNAPAASGSRTLMTFSAGAIDLVEGVGLQIIQGAGTSSPSLNFGAAFWSPTIKFSNVIYGASTNNVGSAVGEFSGNHKVIYLDNWQPQGYDTSSPNGFVPIVIGRFRNTTIPQTTSIYISNSTLKGANVFGDNGAVIGATNLSFFFSNTELLNSGGTNLWNFSGSVTTQINIFATESCRFPTGGALMGVGPNIRLNGPIYAKLSTLAGKFTGQVDGDSCISMEAVNGLPGSAIRVRWSTALAKWMSISPVASNTVTLNGATAVVVAQTLTQATSRIILSTRTTAGGVDSAAFVSAIVAATSFSVKASAGDTGQVLWDMYGTN